MPNHLFILCTTCLSCVSYVPCTRVSHPTERDCKREVRKFCVFLSFFQLLSDMSQRRSDMSQRRQISDGTCHKDKQSKTCNLKSNDKQMKGDRLTRRCPISTKVRKNGQKGGSYGTLSVGPVVRLLWRAAADGMSECLHAPSQPESVSNGKVSRKQTQLGSGGGCRCAEATPTHTHT